MPYKILCKHCSYPLSKNELRSVREVVAKYGLRCPRCLRKLSDEPVEIQISVKKRYV